MIEAFSNNLLEMAKVAWQLDHPQPGTMGDYIDLVKQSQGAIKPEWPSHVPIGGMCEWGLVMPPVNDLDLATQWDRTLAAMRARYELPMPLRITVTTEQRDLLNAAVWFVHGPIMLVTHSITHWRSPTKWLDGKCGVWWDKKMVIPVRKFSIPECDESFRRVWNGVYEREFGVGEHVGRQCVQCGDGAVEWDRDAIPYCARCWTKGQVEWEIARRLWIARTDSQTAF